MKRLAVVTDREHPALTPDDAPLVPAFRARGVEAVPTAWDDPAVDWTGFDALLVRSPWDYHLDPDAFFAWLDRLDRLRVRTFNDRAVLRWNADKRYLRALAQAGVPVIPTLWLDRGSVPDLAARLHVSGWEEVVVKPAVSAAGRDTVRVRRGALGAAEALLARALPGADFLVQPFLPAVLTRGETSLTYLDGACVGAVVKRAAPGQFLIHEEHGGTLAPAEASPAQLAAGARAVAAVAARFGVPLYARVDLLDAAEGPAVVEVELLEPELFLRFVPDGHRRLVDALLAR